MQVEDTGLGIPAAELPHIFESYHQAHLGKGGTGLGLSIVRGLVQAHGGRVTVESAVGELKSLIEAEIVDAERQLSHWRQQERTRADLADYIRPILAAYENQLTALYAALNADQKKKADQVLGMACII